MLESLKQFCEVLSHVYRGFPSYLDVEDNLEILKLRVAGLVKQNSGKSKLRGKRVGVSVYLRLL